MPRLWLTVAQCSLVAAVLSALVGLFPVTILTGILAAVAFGLFIKQV